MNVIKYLNMKLVPKFEKLERYEPRNEKERNLVEALTSLKNVDDTGALLRDLLTQAEIEEFANRLEIARLLLVEPMSYLQIAKKTGASTTTVTRVAHWLFNGCGGYWTVLKRFVKTNQK